MSKAFTSEETPDAAAVVAPRAPLPEGVPNYVTGRGLALLREELAGLRQELSGLLEQHAAPGTPDFAALAQRRAELEARIASAQRVPRPDPPADAVRFGATVTVESDAGTRRYRIVGVDEADPASGLVAFTSPLARALLGKRVGELARLRAPRGDEELELTAIEYEND